MQPEPTAARVVAGKLVAWAGLALCVGALVAAMATYLTGATILPSLRDASVRRHRPEGPWQFLHALPDLQTRAAEGRQLYFPFDSHWNVEGNQLVGELVASELTRRGYLP